MPEKSLREKIGWKPGLKVLLVGLADGLTDPFEGVEHTSVKAGKPAPMGKFDVLLGFALDAAMLQRIAPVLLGSAVEDAKLWICYPKGSSKVKTDLNRDAGWGPMFDAGWIVVAIASVDATWSAVRFRPKALVKSVRFPKAQAS